LSTSKATACTRCVVLPFLPSIPLPLTHPPTSHSPLLPSPASGPVHAHPSTPLPPLLPYDNRLMQERQLRHQVPLLERGLRQRHVRLPRRGMQLWRPEQLHRADERDLCGWYVILSIHPFRSLFFPSRVSAPFPQPSYVFLLLALICGGPAL
jgi:hypothetical protein